MDRISQVKEFVKNECEKPTSKYGREPFDYHFASVVKYALMLAEIHGGDKEIIELAGWLHDIGSIMEGRKDHHITGAKIAEDKLRELNYPEEKISKVVKCIENHRGSQNSERESVEEKIIADADAMSAFDNLTGNMKAAFVYENLMQGEATKAVMKKFENKYNQLNFEESKTIIQPKYEAAKLLLK